MSPHDSPTINDKTKPCPHFNKVMHFGQYLFVNRKHRFLNHTFTSRKAAHTVSSGYPIITNDGCEAEGQLKPYSGCGNLN